MNDTNGPAIIANYLRQLKNISGNPIDSYYYSEMVKEERSIDSLKRGLKKFCEW